MTIAALIAEGIVALIAEGIAIAALAAEGTAVIAVAKGRIKGTLVKEV